MRTNNKTRGKYFEEKIVKEIRKILNLNKYECYRAGSSGARISIEYNGDISFSNPEKFNLIIECKYRLNISLDEIFPLTNNEVNKFIEQNNEQIKLYKEQFGKDKEVLSVVIMGRPHQSIENYYCLINEIPKDKIIDLISNERIICYNKKLKMNYIVITFESFLKIISKMFDEEKWGDESFD